MNERTVFLLDGIGAALSFALSGLILPNFSDALGLSKEAIYTLAIFPATYTIFSLSCYRLVKGIKSWMLLAVICANILYCLISGIVIIFHEGLTDLGTYILFAEILAVIAVVTLELRIYQVYLRSKPAS